MVLDCCCSGDSSDEGKNVSVLASLLDTVYGTVYGIR